METQTCKVKSKYSILERLLMSLAKETGILGTLQGHEDEATFTFGVDSENQLYDAKRLINRFGLSVEIVPTPNNVITVGINKEGDLYKQNE